MGIFLVPRRGLEPPSLSRPAPKAGVSANFTTWARCHTRILGKRDWGRGEGSTPTGLIPLSGPNSLTTWHKSQSRFFYVKEIMVKESAKCLLPRLACRWATWLCPTKRKTTPSSGYCLGSFVRPAGFEPATVCLRGNCSTN